MGTLVDNNTTSQCKAILEALQNGKTITPMDALRDFGTIRLPARINDLRRKGWPIKTNIIKVPAKNQSGFARVAQYTLAGGN